MAAHLLTVGERSSIHPAMSWIVKHRTTMQGQRNLMPVRSRNTVPILFAMFSLLSIPCCFGDGVFAAEARPFASFNVTIEIDIEDGEIDMMATIAAAAGGAGFDFPKETVSLEVTGGRGGYSMTLPAGSFKADRGGGFKFQGAIKGVKVIAAIRPLRGGAYELEMETEGANLKGFSNPVTVRLAVGDNAGSTTVRAKIE